MVMDLLLCFTLSSLVICDEAQSIYCKMCVVNSLLNAVNLPETYWKLIDFLEWSQWISKSSDSNIGSLELVAPNVCLRIRGRKCKTSMKIKPQFQRTHYANWIITISLSGDKT